MASIIVPWAFLWGLALSSRSSAWRSIFSSNSLTPWPVAAAMAWLWCFPPQSSTRMLRLASSSLTFSGLAWGLSILLMAKIRGTPAIWAWLMASLVCGLTPSSAATTMMAMSVSLAPRARMAVKASWPGVSRKTMRLPRSVTTS